MIPLANEGAHVNAAAVHNDYQNYVVADYVCKLPLFATKAVLPTHNCVARDNNF